MGITEQIQNLSARIQQQKDIITTEEATKTAFVMPFINILGYDVFNPLEVKPEFTADIGTKQGEKVDYAILRNNEIVMIIECKKCGDNLSASHTAQLYRYFSVLDCRIGVLTDGIKYKFYSDLEKPNIMDLKPFFDFDMEDVESELIQELNLFTKTNFNLDNILTSAIDLKYTNGIKRYIQKQIKSPDEDFVKFCLDHVYSGIKTKKVIKDFTEIVGSALHQIFVDNMQTETENSKPDLTTKSISEEEYQKAKQICEVFNSMSKAELETYDVRSLRTIASKLVKNNRIVELYELTNKLYKRINKND